MTATTTHGNLNNALERQVYGDENCMDHGNNRQSVCERKPCSICSPGQSGKRNVRFPVLNGNGRLATTRRPMRIKGGYRIVTVLIRQINYNKYQEENQMSRELYNYKRKATTAAKDLWYGDDVLAAIDHATTVNEVARIMKKAREDYVYEE